MLVIISKALLYLSFALLVGQAILTLIPEQRKPVISVPKSWLLFSIILIPILTFLSVHQLINRLSVMFELTYWEMFPIVLFQLAFGKAWLWTIGLTILLLISYLLSNKLGTSSLKRGLDIVQIVIIIGLAAAQAWAGHSASLNQWSGFLSHFSHFLAVIVWIGVLFCVGWFTTHQSNWLSFLRWFTPIAISCVIIVTISGFSMMKLIAPEYVNSWMLSYGQALLLKHLLIIPLLIFAFVNSILIRHQLRKNSAYNPINWLRTESVLTLFIFSASAFMGQQAPPHEVSRTLMSVEPSPLFLFFYQGTVDPSTTLQINVTFTGLFLAFVALVLLSCVIVTFFRKWAVSFSVLFSLLFVILAYVTLMAMIQSSTAETLEAVKPVFNLMGSYCH